MKMMKFEENEINQAFFECAQLSEIFEKIESDLEKDGVVVCQYTINDVDYTTEETNIADFIGRSQIMQCNKHLETKKCS